MRKKKVRFSCQTCGATVECAASEIPCEALGGWFTICCWEGLGEASQYNFCSSTCLKSWVDAQVPRIPAVFLESFGEVDS
jgi:hypothetical protein